MFNFKGNITITFRKVVQIMFYVSSYKDNLIGVTDSEDNIEEFYTKDYLESLDISIIGFNKDLELGYTFTIANLDFRLTKINDITGWTISANYINDSIVFKCKNFYMGYPVISFAEAFKDYRRSNIDISGLDASNVITMDMMFNNARFLTSVTFNDNAPKAYTFYQMFYTCRSLNFVKLPRIKPKNLIEMFYGCTSLLHIDLSMIDATEVIDMSKMFMNCNCLEKIDMSKFKTKSLKDMFGLFHNCCNLEELDLSGLITKGVYSMMNVFTRCESLKYLDLSNFDTSKVETMASMFNQCKSLEEINLSSFNVKNVENMNSMFYECEALKFLDLSNFKPKNILDIRFMFYGCTSLVALDISNLSSNGLTVYNGMYDECENLGVVKSAPSCIIKKEIPNIALLPYKEGLPYDTVIKLKRGTDLRTLLTKLLLTIGKKKAVVGFIEI